MNQNISNNNSKKFHNYNKSLSAYKYKQKIKSNQNQINNYEIWKNHPGYLYYKEFMKYNNKHNKKRTFTGKAFNRKYKLEPIMKPKIKNINGVFQYNEYFPKINGKKNIKNETQINYINRDKKNQYYSLWPNKIWNKYDFTKGNQYGAPQSNKINRKEDYIFKVLNKEKDNLYNKKSNTNKVINNYDKLNQNNIYYNNFMNKKSNINTKKKENNINKKENLFKRDYFINNNNSKEDNKKNNLNNFENNKNINDIHNKKNDKNKEENNENEENDNFDEEKEKLFYTNQKNFFKFRKDIMEEPEYLEEDNDNNEK